jgi:hypothetical protein
MDRSGNRIEPVGTRETRSLSGPDGTTLALLCWNLVKHPHGSKNALLWQIPHFSVWPWIGTAVGLKCLVFVPFSGESR